MSMGFRNGLAFLLFTAVAVPGAEVVVRDTDGALGATRAPVVIKVKLSRSERRAALEGRLQFRELSSASSSVGPTIPVQLFPVAKENHAARVCWLMPAGARGKRIFKLEATSSGAGPGMLAKRDLTNGQFDITDGGKPVLQYNYATVEPGVIITNIRPANLIYARARSDYIHPLFGLDGETLTKDWPTEHPHHRGIYWAWPEVDWHGQRGDLHALQLVFTRPTGKCTVTSGPVFAQLDAENIWKWYDSDPIVHERAIIRAYRATGDDRILDLEFQFTALNDPVLLARRGTLHYGGLNIRLAKVENQEIVFHTDSSNATPRKAWAELSGRFEGAPQPSGIVVLQNDANPDYPGEWVQYPGLNWFQPTFPAGGTRYELKKGKPLVLRFRLWLHRGAKATDESCAARWRAYHTANAPSFFPAPANPKHPSS
jgi:Family of unknown function (DUF6807)